LGLRLRLGVWIILRIGLISEGIMVESEGMADFEEEVTASDYLGTYDCTG
jgi:hypothetical protein